MKTFIRKKLSMDNLKKSSFYFLSLCGLFFIVSSPAYASSGPGVAAGQWLQQQAGALVFGIIAIMAIYFLVYRRFSGLIGFAIIAIVVLFLVFDGSSLKGFANMLMHNIFGF